MAGSLQRRRLLLVSLLSQLPLCVVVHRDPRRMSAIGCDASDPPMSVRFG